MHETNGTDRRAHPARIDLNLLTVFDAVWRTRHVGRAAEALSLSQPATSHALARLRDITGDALFERVPSGVRPTPRAEAMWPEVAKALAAAHTALERNTDPTRLGRRLVLGMTANVALTLLPALMAKVRRAAPDLDLSVRSIDRHLAPDLLRRGVVDAVIGSWTGELSAGLRRMSVYSERLVVVARQGNAALRTELDARRLAGLPHVLVSPSGEPSGPVDIALAQMGLSRRIALVVPDYRMAADAIAASDLIGVLARGPLLRSMTHLPLAHRALPFPLDDIIVDLIAPESAAPLANWIHGLIVQKQA
ncbi:MAG: LysR substrate-binding domain-containing protein [Pseudomonadota bacterium]